MSEDGSRRFGFGIFFFLDTKTEAPNQKRPVGQGGNDINRGTRLREPKSVTRRDQEGDLGRRQRIKLARHHVQ